MNVWSRSSFLVINIVINKYNKEVNSMNKPQDTYKNIIANIQTALCRELTKILYRLKNYGVFEY